MDIIIISEFCEDFSKTDNDRFLYLAKMLTNESDDNKVELVTSSFRHTTKKHRRAPMEEWPFKITFIEEPGYPKNVCLRRFQSHYLWGKNVRKYLEQRKKPDVVYCAVPSLTGPNLVAKYCEKKHIRFVIDVQDLWPEAFQMVVNIPVVSDVGFAPFSVLANSIYKRADAICAVSDTYSEKAAKVNKKILKTTTVFLGTDLATFDKYASEKPVLEKREKEIWLGYAGTLGTSYDLSLVFEAMKKVNNSNLRFIVMGDGPLFERFKEKAKGLNVSFLGRLDYGLMCGVLASCDMVINPIIGSSVASIINKHADYAASGKPVLNTQRSEEYRRLIDEYGMGINCKSGDVDDVAEAILFLVNHPEICKSMGDAARLCAEEKFDRQRCYQELVSVIKGK